MKLYATTIVTDDLPRLREFYEQVLSIPSFGNPIYCELRAPGGTLAITDRRAHPAAAHLGGSKSGSFELTITVPDVDAEFTRLGPLVKEWLEPPTNRFYEWRTAIFRDPDGNVVSIGTPEPWALDTQVTDWNARLSEVLRRQVEDASWLMRNATRGLTDDEYLRELAPSSWSIRRRADASTQKATGAGEWVLDYAAPAGSPPPFTTIAWRLAHIGLITWNARHHFKGEKAIDWDELELMPTASEADAWLTEGARGLCAALATVTEDDLRKSHGGLSGYDRLVRMLREVVHHAAEISCLRDVYRALDAQPT